MLCVYFSQCFIQVKNPHSPHVCEYPLNLKSLRQLRTCPAKRAFQNFTILRYTVERIEVFSTLVGSVKYGIQLSLSAFCGAVGSHSIHTAHLFFFPPSFFPLLPARSRNQVPNVPFPFQGINSWNRWARKEERNGKK